MAGLARRSGALMAAAAGLIVVVGVALAATPEASFTHSPATPLVGEAVTFTPSASDATDGDTIAQVEWDFEDDGTYDAVSAPVDASVQHAYQAAGTYTVRMRVTDSSAESTEVTRDVTVNAAPTASFGFSPQVPLVGETAAFDASASSDPEGAIAGADHDWELDGDDDFDDAQGKQISHAFDSAGPKTVKLRVTDAHGATDVETKTVTVNRAPVANFIYEPQTPKPGQRVEFASTSSDPDGNDTLAAYEWDLDQDGQFDDGSGPNATWTYPQAGTKTVKLRVRDGGGATSVKQRQLTVAGNAPPVAAFRVSPRDPLAGDDVELTSISVDPDGPIASQSWDLDDDGQFDDAPGPVASRVFPVAGPYVVKLRVTDRDGAADVSSLAIQVRARPLPPPPPLELISPFPVIRIAGKSSRWGTRINLLTVRAPAGSTVRVKCRGGGCRSKRVAQLSSSGRPMRLRRFERTLRPGARLAIAVRRTGQIGKHSLFVIRRRKRPLRTDLCVYPGEPKPRGCPF